MAVAEFLAVEWTALRLEAAARAFDVVKDRFDCDCARALKALLAWWLPDRSIVCVSVWSGDCLKGEKKKRGSDKTALRRRYVLVAKGIGRPATSSSTLRDVNGKWQQWQQTTDEDSGWAEGEESAKKNAVYFIAADKGPAV